MVQKQEYLGGGTDTRGKNSSGSHGRDRQNHGEDKERDSMASPKPHSQEAAEMSNLDMQGRSVHRRIGKPESQEQNPNVPACSPSPGMTFKVYIIQELHL